MSKTVSRAQAAYIRYYLEKSQASAIDWQLFDREWSQMQRALKLVRTHGLAKHVPSFVRAFGEVMLARGLWYDLLEWADLGLKTADSACTPEQIVSLHLLLGNAALHTSSLSEAQSHFQAALETASRSNNERQMAAAVADLGLTHIASGAPERGDDCLRQALLLAQSCDDRTMIALTLGNLGVRAVSTGNRDRANKYFTEALSLARQVQSDRAVALWLNGMAGIENEAETSEIRFLEALRLARDNGYRELEGTILVNLGWHICRRRDTQMGIRLVEEALAIARAGGDRFGEIGPLQTLGMIYMTEGNFARAALYVEQGLAIATELGTRSDEAQCLLRLGFVSDKAEQWQVAAQHYLKAAALLQDTGDEMSAYCAVGLLGITYYQIDDYSQSIHYTELALATSRSIGPRELQPVWLHVLGFNHLTLGNPERAAPYFEEGLQVALSTKNQRLHALATWNVGLFLDHVGDYASALDLMRVRLDYESGLGDPALHVHVARVAEVEKRQLEATRARVVPGIW